MGGANGMLFLKAKRKEFIVPLSEVKVTFASK